VIRVILLLAVYIEILLAVSAVMNETPPLESVQMSVVIAGLVPNGLFLAIAVAYAIGAVRIAGRGALVQQSNAIESLRNVDPPRPRPTGASPPPAPPLPAPRGSVGGFPATTRPAPPPAIARPRHSARRWQASPAPCWRKRRSPRSGNGAAWRSTRARHRACM